MISPEPYLHDLQMPLKVPGNLGNAIGARLANMKDPKGPTILEHSAGDGSGGHGWRARAAAEKARAEAARGIFTKRPACLPSGDLGDPRWETAFQFDAPDEVPQPSACFIFF